MASCMNCNKQLTSGMVLCPACAAEYQTLREHSGQTSTATPQDASESESSIRPVLEQMCLFTGFLNDLAVHLSTDEGKCAVCNRWEGCTQSRLSPCYQGVKEFLLAKAKAYQDSTRECCDIYGAYLDKLQAQGGYTCLTAEQALVEEFPYLAEHREDAKYAMGIWMAKHWG